MSAGSRTVIVFIALGSMGIAFWAGRVSTQEKVERDRPVISKSRPDRDNSAESRTHAYSGLFNDCRSLEDFRRAIETIESTADKSEKNRLLAELFRTWLRADSEAALSEVRRVESLRYDNERVAFVFSEWAAMNSAEAAELLGKVLDGRQSDPAAKPVFLDGIDPPVFLLSLVSGLGQTDPWLAAKALEKCAESPARTAAVEVLLQDWYFKDEQKARDWAGSIQDAETRRMVIEVVATKAGQLDSTAEGIKWAVEFEDESDRRSALQAIAGQWSQRHAADAFAWTRDLPDEELKLLLMPAVMRQFAIVDPGAAADWLNLYEASPAMDASVAAYVRAIQHVNPEAALGSAAAITDAVLREKVERAVRRARGH